MQLLGSWYFNLIFIPRRVLRWMCASDIQHLPREFAGTSLQHHRNDLTFESASGGWYFVVLLLIFINIWMLLMRTKFHISNCKGLERSRLVRDFTKTNSLSQLALPTWSSNDMVKQQIFSIISHHHQDHVVRGKKQAVEEFYRALQILGSKGTRQR